MLSTAWEKSVASMPSGRGSREAVEPLSEEASRGFFFLVDMKRERKETPFLEDGC